MKLPFDCTIYDAEPQSVTNPFSGDSCMLSPEAIAVYDTIKGAEMFGVEFFADGNDFPFYARSLQKKTGRAIMAFPSGIVPEQVRVVWRANDSEGYRDKYNGIRYSAPIVGDYTFPVASRIPDEIAKEIRKHGGGLRVKFRLKPDGVLFGWDIEIGRAHV